MIVTNDVSTFSTVNVRSLEGYNAEFQICPNETERNAGSVPPGPEKTPSVSCVDIEESSDQLDSGSIKPLPLAS